MLGAINSWQQRREQLSAERASTKYVNHAGCQGQLAVPSCHVCGNSKGHKQQQHQTEVTCHYSWCCDSWQQADCTACTAGAKASLQCPPGFTRPPQLSQVATSSSYTACCTAYTLHARLQSMQCAPAVVVQRAAQSASLSCYCLSAQVVAKQAPGYQTA
jgi:hypothetical protein